MRPSGCRPTDRYVIEITPNGCKSHKYNVLYKQRNQFKQGYHNRKHSVSNLSNPGHAATSHLDQTRRSTFSSQCISGLRGKRPIVLDVILGKSAPADPMTAYANEGIERQNNGVKMRQRSLVTRY